MKDLDNTLKTERDRFVYRDDYGSKHYEIIYGVDGAFVFNYLTSTKTKVDISLLKEFLKENGL